MPRKTYNPSVDRRRLERMSTEFSQIVRAFCYHPALVRGSFQVFRRRCGKDGCKCADGKLHETAVFVDRSGGKRHLHKLTVTLESTLAKPVREYRRLKKLRARLARLHREALACCDRLCEHRLKAGRRILERCMRR